MINPNSTEWTEQEIEEAVAMNEKIAFCQRVWLERFRMTGELRGYPIPGEVYNSHLASKLNTSEELCLFNKKGEIYLVQRGAGAYEPYPNLWHAPGVTRLLDETAEWAIRRLIASELGFEVWLESCRRIGEGEDGDPPRPLYDMHYHFAIVGGKPSNDRGKWFSQDQLPPQPGMVPSHVPMVRRAFEAFEALEAKQDLVVNQHISDDELLGS